MALWFLVLLVVGLAAVGPLVPPGPTEWDSLAYHLYAPKLYLQHHRIFSIGHMHQTNFPATMEMLYTIGLAYGSDRLSKCFHFLTYLLTICALAGAARKFLPKHRPEITGPLAGLLFATTPVVVWEAGTAYVDVALALYTLLSVLALAAWWQGREHARRWLVLSGLLAGICMGIKMTGGAALLFFLIVVSVGWLWKKKPVDGVAAVAAILAACVVASPWYLKTYVYTGNPVFPFFYRALDGRGWTEKMAADYRAEQESHGLHAVAADVALGTYESTTLPSRAFGSAEPSPLQDLQVRLTEGLFSRGVPPPPIGLLASYFYATFDPNKFWEKPMLQACLGPVFLAFVPLLLLFRRHPDAIWIGLGFAVFWTAIWFTLSQLLRYLLPALPFLALLAAYSAIRLSGMDEHLRVTGEFLPASSPFLPLGEKAGKNGEKAPVPRVANLVMARVVRTAMVLCLIYPLAVNVIPPVLNGDAALGRVPRERYLRQVFDAYPVMEWINAKLPKNSLIATYGEPRLYYLDRDAILADEGHNRIFHYEEYRSADDLIRAYQRVGVTHILINGRFAPSILEGRDRTGRWLRELEEAGRLHPLFGVGGIFVFQVGV